MSEPASLYARFTLSHEQYEAFMNSTPARPASFGDWQSWFDRHPMAGDNRVPAAILGDLVSAESDADGAVEDQAVATARALLPLTCTRGA